MVYTCSRCGSEETQDGIIEDGMVAMHRRLRLCANCCPLCSAMPIEEFAWSTEKELKEDLPDF